MQRDLIVFQRQEEHLQRFVFAHGLHAEIETQVLRLIAGVVAGEAPADRLRFHRPEFVGERDVQRQPGAQPHVVRREMRQHRRIVITLGFVYLAAARKPDRDQPRDPDAAPVARFEAEGGFVGFAEVKLPDLIVGGDGAPAARIGGETGSHRIGVSQIPFAHELSSLV